MKNMWRHELFSAPKKWAFIKGIFLCGMLFSASASALYALSDDESVPEDVATAVATATTQSVPAGQPTSELATALLDEASAVPQAAAAPQVLEEVASMPRVVVAEEVEALIRGAGNSEVTDEQKTIMIDIMSKVHEVVAELHIKLVQQTARWISPENTTQNEADQKAARGLFEKDLKEAMTAEEAAAESRRIQALYVEERASNNERMINFIGDMPTAMKCLFKRWMVSSYSFGYGECPEFLGAFTAHKSIITFFQDPERTEEVQITEDQHIGSLLKVLEPHYLRFKEDEATKLQAFEQRLMHVKRMPHARAGVKTHALGLLSKLKEQNVLSEAQLAVFAKTEVLDVVADTLIPLCEEGVQSWVYAHMGKAPDANIAGGEVSFKSAPKYAHLFKDIYVLLLQLLESDRENRYVRPDQSNADVFNALFGYQDM